MILEIAAGVVLGLAIWNLLPKVPWGPLTLLLLFLGLALLVLAVTALAFGGLYVVVKRYPIIWIAPAAAVGLSFIVSIFNNLLIADPHADVPLIVPSEELAKEAKLRLQNDASEAQDPNDSGDKPS